MAGRAHIPTSPACGQWETLLAEALDGLLRPEDEPTFTSHMAGCAACASLFEEARRGREWLDFLSAEPEIPAGLLDKILAQTGPGQAAGFGILSPVASAPGGIPLHSAQPAPLPAWHRPGFMGYIRRFAEPRLMMTAAMAFFSIALTLNLTGVRVSQLRWSSLRPTAVRAFMQRQITVASTPIVRYYDHLRLVYEVQSRVRELRRNQGENNQNQNQPSGPGQSNQNPNHKDGGSKVDPPQQSVAPSFNDDLLESSLSLHDRPAQSGGTSPQRQFLAYRVPRSGNAWERSTIWTA